MENMTPSIDAYLLEEHSCQMSSNPIWNEAAFRLFWRGRPNKMSSYIRSAPDLKSSTAQDSAVSNPYFYRQFSHWLHPLTLVKPAAEARLNDGVLVMRMMPVMMTILKPSAILPCHFPFHFLYHFLSRFLYHLLYHFPYHLSHCLITFLHVSSNLPPSLCNRQNEWLS